MSEGADAFGEVSAEFKSFYSIGVDEAEIEFKHFWEKVFWDVAIEQQLDFFFAEIAVVSFEDV